MFVVFTTQYFSQTLGAQPEFQSDSDALVIRKIEAGLSLPDEFAQYGGFLHDDENELYVSQLGLQGTIYHTIYQLVRPVLSAEVFLALMRMVNALLFIILVFALASHLLGSYPLVATAIAALLVLLFAWTTYFSTSLYWILWAQFLPFAVAFLLYPRVVDRRMSFLAFCAIIAALVLFKSLSGYEYITNVIAAPSVALVYYGIKEKMPLRTLILRIIAVGIAGVIGFAAAIQLHLLQGILFFGSIEQTLDRVLSRASIRTFGERPAACSQGNVVYLAYRYMIISVLPDNIVSPLAVLHAVAFAEIGLVLLPAAQSTRWMKRLFSRVVLIGIALVAAIALIIAVIRYVRLDGDWLAGILLTLGVGIALLVWARLINSPPPEEKKQSYDLRALAIATLYALPISWTWFVLAQGHMACHFHINAIVFFLPFGLLVAYLTALFVLRGVFVSKSATPTA